ncbi:bifunctional protein-serine/threonine kinase/phosphatase [Cognatazoarcus halotolerans]|uniref:bifunctional protein-serine/threonine kinase/phosphatase n=1 Tax=Cognatazoarcus halotolerans TaxID=2686016 RepID=UPI00135A02E8|nr:bifunctional protein-serine/threonine kinase/phosphatase [Cognatazoarcus halotolerans]MCB1898272.1 bifunctional protein-serine/threonine kinase/phosphatase [Rhodocyclaceae bacterium]
MSSRLSLSTGQYSDRGRKEINQDFHGLCIPDEPLLSTKGIAIALADGISSSEVSHIASESAVKSFLDDYLCTSDAWSVRTSAERVLGAINSWLDAQTRRGPHRHDRDRGYVCTFSALILKATTAHIVHVGDSRIYRLRDGALEQLTNDHRMIVSEGQSYLSRALGMSEQVDIDYQSVPLREGDAFVLATDGVYESATPAFIIETIARHADQLDTAAQLIAEEAFARGSKDNLTIQIARIDTLPQQASSELQQQLAALPPAPILEPRMLFDGYRIIRALHGSSRSHIYLAEDGDGGDLVAIKVPSIDLRGDPAYLERFMLEEWIARRINSAHVLKPRPPTRTRNYLYVVTEYIEGQTLAQWMRDNPAPGLETVRGIVEQIARGLLAFHRMEMLHQDLRPNNVMIDGSGTAKIIDFGSTRVAGLAEADPAERAPEILGTAQYTAPEYFLGEAGSPNSDLFSLGVIAYQMLSGRLPYGAQVAKSRTRAAQKKLHYASVLDEHREIPAWVDAALAKAVHPDPFKRYAELSEFSHDLRHPNLALTGQRGPALIERNPVLFWKGMSLLLGVLVIVLLGINVLGT